MDLYGFKDTYNAAVRFVDRNVVEGRGDKVAIRTDDSTMTYEVVQKKVNQFGNALKQKGVDLEDRVLMICYDTPAFIISFFGAIKIGAVPTPVNTLMQLTDYEYFLNYSRAKVLVVEADIWQKLAHLRERFIFLKHVIVIDDHETDSGCDSFDDLLDAQDDTLEPALTVYDDAGFWLYSSGSTGNPKGVVHLQHDMEYAYDSYAKQILQITEDDVTFSASKLFFAYGLGNGLYFPFGAGASTVLLKGRPNPENVFETIEKYRPTIFFGVPTLYGSMLNYLKQSGKTYDLSSLRVCVSAGEALPASLYNRWKETFQVDILDGIGSTEAAHIYLSNRLDDIRPGSTGKPVPGYDVKIVDLEGNPVPPNEPGDLYVRGDSLAECYWNMHEKNKKQFLGDWYYTGDKYYRDEDGYYWYFGRSDDMLKVSGIWVSPIEIENTLMEHEEVFEVAVIGVETKDRLTKPKAFVVLRETAAPTKELEDELKQFVKDRLAPYKYPRMIEFVDSLPKTATGKIQRFRLRAKEKDLVEQ